MQAVRCRRAERCMPADRRPASVCFAGPARLLTRMSESGSPVRRRIDLRSPRLSPEKRFVVGLNTHPNELPRNYYGTRVITPRRDNERISVTSPRTYARPWREPRLSARVPPLSPRVLPTLQPLSPRGISLPWGGSPPLPWMVQHKNGSMADEQNRVPEAHFKKLMQEAKDAAMAAAMADGEVPDHHGGTNPDPPPPRFTLAPTLSLIMRMALAPTLALTRASRPSSPTHFPDPLPDPLPGPPPARRHGAAGAAEPQGAGAAGAAEADAGGRRGAQEELRLLGHLPP